MPFDEPPLLFRRSLAGPVFLVVVGAGLAFLVFGFVNERDGALKVVMGIGAAVLLWLWLVAFRLVMARVPLRLTPSGFEARGWGIPFVRWSDVVESWVERVGKYRTPYLCLRLIDPESVRRRMGWRARLAWRVNAALDRSDLALTTSWLVPRFEQLLRYAELAIAAARAERQAQIRAETQGAPPEP